MEIVMTLGFVFLIAYMVFAKIAKRQERQEYDEDSDEKKEKNDDGAIWYAYWCQHFSNNDNNY